MLVLTSLCIGQFQVKRKLSPQSITESQCKPEAVFQFLWKWDFLLRLPAQPWLCSFQQVLVESHAASTVSCCQPLEAKPNLLTHRPVGLQATPAGRGFTSGFISWSPAVAASVTLYSVVQCHFVVQPQPTSFPWFSDPSLTCPPPHLSLCVPHLLTSPSSLSMCLGADWRFCWAHWRLSDTLGLLAKPTGSL